jgi:hypothetical protein
VNVCTGREKTNEKSVHKVQAPRNVAMALEEKNKLHLTFKLYLLVRISQLFHYNELKYSFDCHLKISSTSSCQKEEFFYSRCTPSLHPFLSLARSLRLTQMCKKETFSIKLR